jgi:hypothetical protein
MRCSNELLTCALKPLDPILRPPNDRRTTAGLIRRPTDSPSPLFPSVRPLTRGSDPAPGQTLMIRSQGPRGRATGRLPLSCETNAVEESGRLGAISLPGPEGTPVGPLMIRSQGPPAGVASYFFPAGPPEGPSGFCLPLPFFILFFFGLTPFIVTDRVILACSQASPA